MPNSSFNFDNSLNNGVSIINYTGHGWTGGWGNGAALDNADVDALENDNMLPFVITVGCNVGEFDAASAVYAEAWQRATNNSGYSKSCPTDCENKSIVISEIK